ncbi:amidohydrolase family protein [Cesiribacter sp. SM1]|uniref:amidohydrolase family protein n=1 Tax=Cesiribacter sp. SM1 TaxID=2861196 RepID=UPI001CD71405|nr:amidohydrolase family protein [Cesiribacter sp. SM1]
MMRILAYILAALFSSSLFCQAQSPDDLLLKDYRPQSIYKIPVTRIAKARYPVIDMHSHAYARSEEELNRWIAVMDKAGIEKTIILTYATGPAFDSTYQVYARYGNRFEVWCGFDYTGYMEPGWSEQAVRELERCYRVGARGVGELGDKGLGELYSKPVPGRGMHIDDARIKPLLEKCAELKMPISVHVAEPMWMYQPMDATNDGLMNAHVWQIDTSEAGFLNHAALIGTLENAVRENPATTFIACHFANCEWDLEVIGRLLKKYPNLYADISARYGETAPIPRQMQLFYKQHQNKLLYGTDMGMEAEMYQTTFRILESTDEHFYETERFNYHWPLHGFGLRPKVLKKLYRSNAARILKRK